MTQINIFENEKYFIRQIERDGEVRFVAKDISDSLQYARSNDAIRQHVHDDDTVFHRIMHWGKMRDMICVNESWIYALIFWSTLESAKQFKRRVTKEVLPSIRKTWGYWIQKHPTQVLIDRAMQKLPRNREKTFPDWYYWHIYRLKNRWEREGRNPPQCVGWYTRNIVYDRIIPWLGDAIGVIAEEIKSQWSYKKLHQYLSSDTGIPLLKGHLSKVEVLMTLSSSRPWFMARLEIAIPKFWSTQYPLFDDM